MRSHVCVHWPTLLLHHLFGREGGGNIIHALLWGIRGKETKKENAKTITGHVASSLVLQHRFNQASVHFCEEGASVHYYLAIVLQSLIGNSSSHAIIISYNTEKRTLGNELRKNVGGARWQFQVHDGPFWFMEIRAGIPTTSNSWEITKKFLSVCVYVYSFL